MDRSLFGIYGTGNICVELVSEPVADDESEESENEPNPIVGAPMEITCADGSTVTCNGGTQGCFDLSPTLCPYTPPEANYEPYEPYTPIEPHRPYRNEPKALAGEGDFCEGYN